MPDVRRGRPAGVLQGQHAPIGQAVGEGSSSRGDLSKKPRVVVVAAAAEQLAIQEAAHQGVLEDLGARDAALVQRHAADGPGGLLVLEPALLDVVGGPGGAARRRAVLLDLEVLLLLFVWMNAKKGTGLIS